MHFFVGGPLAVHDPKERQGLDFDAAISSREGLGHKHLVEQRCWVPKVRLPVWASESVRHVLNCDVRRVECCALAQHLVERKHMGVVEGQSMFKMGVGVQLGRRIRQENDIFVS